MCNPANSKLAREMFKNLRLACCVSGMVTLRVSEEDLRETLQLLADRAGLAPPQPNWALVGLPRDHPLRRVELAFRRRHFQCDKCRWVGVGALTGHGALPGHLSDQRPT